MSAGDDAPLLLHSLENFSRELLGCLDDAAPKRIMEIGSESGGFTLVLARWAREHDATLVSVDPFPPRRLREDVTGHDRVQIVAGVSPWVLDELEPADAYVIDGDHNYWTVAAELRAAFRGQEPGPLVILHDVGWPCARRDAYYAPERLPAEAVHEYVFSAGVRPGVGRAGPGGMRGAGAFAFAVDEGGPRNGVLTAVEDFMAERDDLEFVRIPCIFGVGILFPRQAEWAPKVTARVGPLHEHPLLERLEQNRLALYAKVLDLQDRSRAGNAFDRTLADLHGRIAELEAQNAALVLAHAGAQPFEAPT